MSPQVPEASSIPSLLAELDRRQDDVLERLDELDRRIISLIEVWTGTRWSPETAISDASQDEVVGPDSFEDEALRESVDERFAA